MRTRKSLLPIVLLCVTVVSLALCQEKRWPKAATKHRDKSAKGKYDPDYGDRREDSAELYYDQSSAANGYYDSESLDTLAANRSNRAIDNSRYVVKTKIPRRMSFFLSLPFDTLGLYISINIFVHIFTKEYGVPSEYSYVNSAFRVKINNER